jgi:hypothetical protein
MLDIMPQDDIDYWCTALRDCSMTTASLVRIASIAAGEFNYSIPKCLWCIPFFL